MKYRELKILNNKILNLYKNLDAQIDQLKADYKISCNNNCAKCCYYENVYANILEFIPFVLNLYEQNLLYDFYHLKIQDLAPGHICVLLNQVDIDNVSGNCSFYSYRGLICRLFGFSAIINKNNEKIFSTCKIIKSNFSDSIKTLNSDISKINISVISDYYSKLYSFNPGFLKDIYPINTAIKKAIEFIFFIFYYNKPGKKKAA